jgi:hypothetical protein
MQTQGEEMMKKAELLDTLAEVHRSWNQLLERIPRERMTEPEALGDWSIKDAIAHVAWVETQTLIMLRAESLVGAGELWRMPTDERNAAVVAASRARSLDEILGEARTAQRELRELVANIRPEDIDGADWFAELPGAWPPARVIEVNVVEHYWDHIEELARWYRRNA